MTANVTDNKIDVPPWRSLASHQTTRNEHLVSLFSYIL